MSQLQSKLSAEKIPAKQWVNSMWKPTGKLDPWKQGLAPSKHLPGVPIGAHACPVWKYSKFIIYIICLWNFWNRPKNKKVSSIKLLTRQLPGGACECPGIPSAGAKIFFFKDGYTPQKAMLKKFLEFSLPISDICQLQHFRDKLNMQFSELNITPSIRPNLGIFKNFWNWISTFRQSLLVKKLSLNWI